MAFGTPTQIVAFNSKVGFGLQPTLTAGAAAGSLVVLSVGSDNTATTDVTTSDDVVSVTDSKGNIYTLAAAQTNGQGAAQAGVSGSIWYSNITTALTTSDWINVTNTTSGYARAMIAATVSMGAGNMATVVGVARGVGDTGADPSAVISGLPSANTLYIGMSVDETTTGAGAYTGFTRLNIQASSGGAAASNVATSFQYANDTASTGKTFIPATAVDAAAVLVAFRETAIVEKASEMSVWTGSDWVVKPVKVWDGANWNVKPVKRWTGSQWI